MLAALCLWSAIFFVLIMPGDGMAISPPCGENINDYPHARNAAVLAIVWGMWIVPCLIIAKIFLYRFGLVVTYVLGFLYVMAIVGQQTCVQPACTVLSNGLW